MSVNVLIDPGHGGQTGFSVGKYKEDDFNLLVARQVVLVGLSRGFRVDQTRYEDEVVTLVQRSAQANTPGFGGKKYAAFVSVHHNDSGRGEGVEGYQVYSYPNHEWSPDLGFSISSWLGRNSNTRHSRWSGKVIYGNYSVLRRTRIPACLVECGFMSDKDDLARILSFEYQKEVGKSIWQGIETFLRSRFSQYI